MDAGSLTVQWFQVPSPLGHKGWRWMPGVLPSNGFNNIGSTLNISHCAVTWFISALQLCTYIAACSVATERGAVSYTLNNTTVEGAKPCVKACRFSPRNSQSLMKTECSCWVVEAKPSNHVSIPSPSSNIHGLWGYLTSDLPTHSSAKNTHTS